MNDLVRVEGIEVVRSPGGFVLRVSMLQVAAGEMVALTGPSGSGKTTLLHVIAGLVPSKSGSVTVGGRAVQTMGESARRHFRRTMMGIVFQSGGLIPYLTVEENVTLPHRLNHLVGNGNRAAARSNELLDRVGLGDMRRRFPGELSGGEQQRVAVCRALLTKPEIVLADEPTASLDAEAGEIVARVLVDECRERGAALVCATHDDVMLGHVDRAVRLERGAILP